MFLACSSIENRSLPAVSEVAGEMPQRGSRLCDVQRSQMWLEAPQTEQECSLKDSARHYVLLVRVH